MGFVGTERRNAVDELGVEVGPRGTVAADADWATNVPGVFVCGDQTRGQSLIVWAIAEGRSCAAAVDRWLMGDDVAAGADRARASWRCAEAGDRRAIPHLARLPRRASWSRAGVDILRPRRDDGLQPFGYMRRLCRR